MVLHRPSDQWRGVVGVFGWGWVMFFRVLAWLLYFFALALGFAKSYDSAAYFVACGCFLLLENRDEERP